MEKRYYGFHRSRVVDNRDPEKFGRVLIHIPDLMPELDPEDGIWARPANNPVGGRNVDTDHKPDHHYMGSSYIPKIGSWQWIFFENGNPNLPYYFAACDIEHSKVLPENQVGEEYEHKWTLLKTHQGRTIHISDDDPSKGDPRVEITGRKKNLHAGGPLKGSGTTSDDHIYKIEGNMNTILIDEREGKEKILIKTHKGDYIHVDVDEQKLQCYFKSDINIETGGNLNITTLGEIHIEATGSIYETTKAAKHLKATGIIATDGIHRFDQSGKSVAASPDKPEGKRDT